MTYTRHLGDGVTQNYTIPFPYLSRNHVTATVDNAAWPFEWISSNTVRFATPPPEGTLVDIRRTTPKVEPLVVFTDGSTEVAKNHNTSVLQLLYSVQEAFDVSEGALVVRKDGSLGARGRRIGDVRPPVEPDDVVPLKWLIEYLSDFIHVRFKVSTETEGRPLTVADTYRHLRIVSDDPVTITVPDLDWPDGCEIYIEQAGDGTVSFDAAPGVVFRHLQGEAAETAARHAVVGLKWLGGGEWLLFGALGWAG